MVLNKWKGIRILYIGRSLLIHLYFFYMTMNNALLWKYTWESERMEFLLILYCSYMIMHTSNLHLIPTLWAISFIHNLHESPWQIYAETKKHMHWNICREEYFYPHRAHHLPMYWKPKCAYMYTIDIKDHIN